MHANTYMLSHACCQMHSASMHAATWMPPRTCSFMIKNFASYMWYITGGTIHVGEGMHVVVCMQQHASPCGSMHAATWITPHACCHKHMPHVCCNMHSASCMLPYACHHISSYICCLMHAVAQAVKMASACAEMLVMCWKWTRALRSRAFVPLTTFHQIKQLGFDIVNVMLAT